MRTRPHHRLPAPTRAPRPARQCRLPRAATSTPARWLAPLTAGHGLAAQAGTTWAKALGLFLRRGLRKALLVLWATAPVPALGAGGAGSLPLRPALPPLGQLTPLPQAPAALLDLPAHAAWALLLRLAARVPMAYRVSYRAISRRVRKLLRVKQRFLRVPLAVPPHRRLLSGLRLLRFCLLFLEPRTFRARLGDALAGLGAADEDAPFALLWAEQQRSVVSTFVRGRATLR